MIPAMTLPRFATALCCTLWLALVVPACVTSETQSSPDHEGYYSLTSQEIVWVTRAVQERRIHSLWLDPLTLVPTSPVVRQTFTREAMGRAAAGFALAMEVLLAPSYPLSRQRDPGTVRMTARLTDKINVVQLAKRGAHVGATASGLLPSLALEIEFSDTVTGELLAAVTTQRLGRQLMALASRGGSSDDYAQLFSGMAVRIRDGFDRAGPWGLAQ